MAKKNTTKPVIAPAKTVSAPVSKPAKVSRETVLISTTPAKLSELVGADTTVLVSRKHLRNLITKASADKALAGL